MASGGGKSWSIITAASTKTGRPRYLRARPNLRRESARQRAVRRCPSIRRNSSSIWRTIRKSRCCHAPCIQHVSLRGAISPVHWTKSSVYQASRQAGRHVDGYIAQYTGYAGKQSNVQTERYGTTGRQSKQGTLYTPRKIDGRLPCCSSSRRSTSKFLSSWSKFGTCCRISHPADVCRMVMRFRRSFLRS